MSGKGKHRLRGGKAVESLLRTWPLQRSKQFPHHHFSSNILLGPQIIYPVLEVGQPRHGDFKEDPVKRKINYSILRNFLKEEFVVFLGKDVLLHPRLQPAFGKICH